MNPTVPLSPVYHEKRFCASLFISQVLVVLFCALLLYFTLNCPSTFRDTETLLESSNSTDNDNGEEVEWEDPGSAWDAAPTQNTTIVDSVDSSKLEINDNDDDNRDEDCMFIQRNKLPKCATEPSTSSTNGTQNEFPASTGSKLDACNVLVQLICNGKDFRFEDDEDEDGISAAVSCPPWRPWASYGSIPSQSDEFPPASEIVQKPAAGLILRLEETNDVFNCSIVKDSGLTSHREALCLSNGTNANFCFGLLLSCTCMDSHSTTKATLGNHLTSNPDSDAAEVNMDKPAPEESLRSPQLPSESPVSDSDGHLGVNYE